MLRINFLKDESTRYLFAGLLDSSFLIKPNRDFLKRTLNVLRSSTISTAPTTHWGCIQRTISSGYSSKSYNEDTSPTFKTSRRPTSSSHPSTKTNTQTVQVGPHTWHFETTSSPTTPNGSITLKIGDTVVLASVSTNLPPPPPSSPSSSPSLQNFNNRRRNQGHRLQVNYREPSYASSKIPPIYARREAIPTHQEMLQSCHIDRTIRHLFPSGLSYDTTANINILSTPPPTTATTIESSSSLSSDVAALNAISAAITASSGTIPWYGPIAAARVCLVPLLLSGDAIQTRISKNNKTTKKQPYMYKTVVNPDQDTIAQSKVSVLVVVNAHGEVVSMQIRGEQVGEEEVEMVLERGIQEAGKLILPQLALLHNANRGASNAKRQEVELSGADAEASAVVHQLAGPRIATILSSTTTTTNSPSSSSLSTSSALYNAKLQLIEDLRRRGAWRTDFARTPGSGCVSPDDLDPAFTSAVHAELRKLIIHKGYRPPDGRGLGDVRRVSAQLNFLPVPHGSALVSCSSSSSMDAQALGVVTVGGRRDAALMMGSGKLSPSVFGSTATTSSFIADTSSSSNSSSDNNYSRFTTYVATSPMSTPNASSSGGGNYRPNPREQLQQDADHAAFLEIALCPILPCSAEFPFPMRVNVELLPFSSSSSTMFSLLSAGNDASTIASSYSCSSSLVGSASLALVTAGVPIKSLVAATTIGLVATDEERRWWRGEKRMHFINNDADDDVDDGDRSKCMSQTRYEMLTDMSSIESTVADVELKAAGTNQGLTAVQLNVKLAHGRGVGADVIKAALKRARKVHLDVLRDMEDALRQQPNMKMPVVDYVYVHENALPAVIGVQGSKIQNLEDVTGAKVWVDFTSPHEVGTSSSSRSTTMATSPSTSTTPTASTTTTTSSSSSSSSILVYAPSKAIFNAAKQGLLASSGDTLIEGRIYPAQVTMVKDFGVFVDVGPAQVRALLHISEISNEKIRSVQDCLKVGQKLEVMALGRGSKGELRVSARKVVGGHSKKEEEDGDGDVGEGVFIV